MPSGLKMLTRPEMPPDEAEERGADALICMHDDTADKGARKGVAMAGAVVGVRSRSGSGSRNQSARVLQVCVRRK
eukprot:1469964-Pleurochrysis_carterae.AAC.2